MTLAAASTGRADRSAGPASSRGPGTPTPRAGSSATGCGSSTRSTGSGEPTDRCCCPPGRVVHSRHVEDADSLPGPPRRVVTFDGRGNGRSDRPAERSRYADGRVRGRRARRAGRHRHRTGGAGRLAAAALWALVLAADHPERVARIVYIGPPSARLPSQPRTDGRYNFDERYDTYEGWAKYNRHYWRRDYPDFLQFFFEQVLQRAALHQADRGLRRLGTRDRSRDADRRDRTATSLTTSTARRGSVAGSAARRW